MCVVGDAQRGERPAGEVNGMGHEWDKEDADAQERERQKKEDEENQKKLDD